MSRTRADVLLVVRGLVESRSKARAAIEAGGVTADGARVMRASDLVADGAALHVEPAFPWVSRAGTKLAHALDVFHVSPEGRVCLDVGASTGGFTQVLLQRGAHSVYAVDVGQGQLHPSLRDDPRVINLERTDARALTSAHLPQTPSLVVCDASFIGAAKVLAAPLSLAAERADLIVLIKPQFEAGPKAGKSGVLSEPVAREAIAATAAAIDGLAGFTVLSVVDSPIRGGEGNLEALLFAARR